MAHRAWEFGRRCFKEKGFDVLSEEPGFMLIELAEGLSLGEEGEEIYRQVEMDLYAQALVHPLRSLGRSITWISNNTAYHKCPREVPIGVVRDFERYIVPRT